MKILYYNIHDGSFMTEWQKVHIYDELAHSGVEFDIVNPLSFQSLEQCNEDLVKRLKEDNTIDAFLTCLPDEYFLPGVMEQIALFSVPKILIQFDNLHAPYHNRRTSCLFDIVWLTSWETESMFKKWGCKTIFLPYAANPYLYLDRYSKDINKVCFVGTPYGSRTQFINELVSGGVGFDVFFGGNNGAKKQADEPNYVIKGDSVFKTVCKELSFPIGRSVLLGKLKSKLSYADKLAEDNPFLSMKDSLSFKAMNEAYSNYSLSLNVLALRNTYSLRHPVHKLHLRTFEIPMSAGLELVSYNDELARYFSEKEMVFFKDKEEMIDKARFFVSDKQQSLCREMKMNARKRAETEHTWTCRFRKVLEMVGLNF